MIFGSVIILFIVVIAYWHYTQGLFSATLSLICCICAAVLAFSYHETIVQLLLQGKAVNYAHAMVLVACFSAFYGILRVVFDSAVPGNVRLPSTLDKIGGAVVGAIAGVFCTGVLAIAAQQLPFGPSVGGYARYTLDSERGVTIPTARQAIDASVYDELREDREPGDSDGFADATAQRMIVPSDQALIALVSHLSVGALSNDHPLDVVHPNYLDELFGQRLGVQVGANRVMMTSQNMRVSGIFLVDQLSQVEGELDSIRKRSLPSVIKSDSGHALLVLRVEPPLQASDTDHNFRFSPASMPIIANGKLYTPLGTLDSNGLMRANRVDDYLVASTDGDVDLVYLVDREDVLVQQDKTFSLKKGVYLDAKRAPIGLDTIQVSTRWTPGKNVVMRKTLLPKPKEPPVTPNVAPAAAPSTEPAPSNEGTTPAAPAAPAAPGPASSS